jgi:hypothetical protein
LSCLPPSAPITLRCTTILRSFGILALKTIPSGRSRHNNRNTHRIKVTATNYFQTQRNYIMILKYARQCL